MHALKGLFDVSKEYIPRLLALWSIFREKKLRQIFFKGPPTLHLDDGKWRRQWIFRVTLSCSRREYEEAMFTQDRTYFLRAIEHTFISFGGVPEVLRHNNLRRRLSMPVFMTRMSRSSMLPLPVTGASPRCQ